MPVSLAENFHLSTIKLSLADSHSLSLSCLFLLSAYDLAKEQKLNFGDDIAGTVRLAKKKV